MPIEPRDVRVTWPIAGIGGFLDVEWVSSGTGSTQTTGGPGKLEVERWELNHDYDNAELPLSGGKGSMTRYRAGDDFEFTCIVLLDMRPAAAGGTENTFNGQPFLDGRLEGHAEIDTNFHFSLRLQCGDPSFWVNAARRHQPIPVDVGPRKGVYYFCPRVILTQTRTLDSSKGKPPDGLLRAIVRGKGSTPLERWVDDVMIARGGLGFDQPGEG